MKKFFKRLITPGSFASSIATLSSGTGVGQLIMFVSSPVLMRLYEPAIFGDLAILVSLTLIMATVFTLRFEMAIPLPEEDGDAHELIFLSISIVTGLAGLTLILLTIFTHGALELLNLTSIGYWILILPLTIFNEAIINILGFWFIRKNQFMVMALSRTLYSGSIVLLQMFFAPFVNSTQVGLVLGFAIGQLVPLIFLITKYFGRDVIQSWKNLTLTNLLNQVRTYRQFPLFASWNSAFNTIGRQIPPIIISYFFPKELVGQYAVALRMLNMPFTLLGNSVGQVYYQRITQLIRSKSSISKFTYTTMLKAGAIIFFPLLILLTAGPWIFSTVLGSEWIMAGRISQMLVPIYLIRFMVSPVSNLFAAIQQQQRMMSLQLSLVLVSLGTFYFGGATGSFMMTIGLYSGFTTLVYVSLIFIIKHAVRNYERNLDL